MEEEDGDAHDGVMRVELSVFKISTGSGVRKAPCKLMITASVVPCTKSSADSNVFLQ